MRKLMTLRRLAGLALGLAGLVLIALGTIGGTAPWSWAGIVMWGLLGFGLLAALIQRVMVVMQLAASTRQDASRMLSFQENFPAMLRKQLAEQAGAQRAEFTRLRNEAASDRRALQAGMAQAGRERATLLEEMINVAKVQSAHGAALTAALEASISRLREQHQELKAELARALSEQDELRRLILDGNDVSLRVYRDIRSDLDSREGRFDALGAELHEAIARQQAATSDIANGLERQLEATNAQRAIGDSVIATVMQVNTAVRELESAYGNDRLAVQAFLRDEKKLRSLSRPALQWLKSEVVREIEALMQLRQLLNIETPMPLLGGWAMDPEAMLTLVRMVIERKPRCIVELGSGTSTLWLAMALRAAGGGRIVSYDHLEHYAALTATALRDHGLDAWGEVRCAPLAATDIGGVSYPWYDINAGTMDAPIDLLIVDGPPAGTGEMARFPAIPKLQSSLADGAVVVVDDALRPDEKKMMKLWRDAFPGLAEGEPLGSRTTTLVFSREVGAASQAAGDRKTA